MIDESAIKNYTAEELFKWRETARARVKASTKHSAECRRQCERIGREIKKREKWANKDLRWIRAITKELYRRVSRGVSAVERTTPADEWANKFEANKKYAINAIRGESLIAIKKFI